MDSAGLSYSQRFQTFSNWSKRLNKNTRKLIYESLCCQKLFQMKMLSEDSISVNSLFVEPPKQHKSFSLVSYSLQSYSLSKFASSVIFIYCCRGNVKRSRIMIPSALVRSTWAMTRVRARGRRGSGKLHRWPTFLHPQWGRSKAPNSPLRSQSVGCWTLLLRKTWKNPQHLLSGNTPPLRPSARCPLLLQY